MESIHILHASVAALLTAFASGTLEFVMAGELTPLIAGVAGVLVGCAYLVAVHFLPKWKKQRGEVHTVDADLTDSESPTELQPLLEQEGLAAGEITGDGKDVAKMMLRAPDLAEVERLRTTYKRAKHPEGRLFEHFVNKAYSYRLDKAGDRDKAQEFYYVTESQDKDSVRENIEFALLVQETKEDAEHDERGER